MTSEQLNRFRKTNPHVELKLTHSKYILIEKTWNEEYGTYRVVRRDCYQKSNGKGCYVDNDITLVRVERSKLKPSRNGYAWCVKHSQIKSVLQTVGITQ